MRTSERKTITAFALVLLAAGCRALGADTSSAAQGTTDITNLPSYTLHKGDTVLVQVGIWPYFSLNGLTDPNSMFPDTLVITGSGEDPGDCRNEFVLGQPICANYRFRCMTAVPRSPVNDPAHLYLIDMYAEALGRPGDPKGTCYASEVLSADGTSSLMLLAFVAAERELYSQDIQATRGLIQFLAGGSAGMQPGGTSMTFEFEFNPRPTDPQTFTFAGFKSGVGMRQAFTTSMNSEWYPNPQAGKVLNVFVKPAK